MKVHFFSLILLTLITIPRAHTKEVNFLPTPETIDDADCIMKIDYRDLIIGDFSWDQVKAHVEGILTEKGYEVIFQDRTLQEIIAEGREHDQKSLAVTPQRFIIDSKHNQCPIGKSNLCSFIKCSATISSIWERLKFRRNWSPCTNHWIKRQSVRGSPIHNYRGWIQAQQRPALYLGTTRGLGSGNKARVAAGPVTRPKPQVPKQRFNSRVTT